MAVETMDVGDLKVLITGGARGIGGATAKLLASGGAHVLICDVLDADGEALAQELGERVHYAHLDVTSERDWKDALERAESKLGGLNALFNNAGIVAFSGITDCTPHEFQKVIDVNLFGVFLGLHVCAPALKRSGNGVVVNTSSTAGLQGYAGIAAYVASKWGVRGLTKAAALDLAADQIRVCSLHPGPIHTPMTAGLGEETVSAQPMPRFGEPEEVARMVRFLLTEATYSTGSEFTIDGGAVTGDALQFPDEP